MQSVRLSLQIPAAGAEPLVWVVRREWCEIGEYLFFTVVVGGVHPNGDGERWHATLSEAVAEIHADQMALLAEFDPL